MFVDDDSVRLCLNDMEGLGLLRLELFIAGSCHFDRCTSIASQWLFVDEHPLIGCELWVYVDFGTVVLFVLSTSSLHLRTGFRF